MRHTQACNECIKFSTHISPSMYIESQASNFCFVSSYGKDRHEAEGVVDASVDNVAAPFAEYKSQLLITCVISGSLI